MKNSNLIKIHSDEKRLSEEQELFNKLSEQIEKKKKELAKWERYAEDHRHKYAKYFYPLENKLYECRKKLIFLFDTRLEDTDFNNGEKRKLKTLIYDMCLDLLNEKYDEKLEVIFKKYSKPKTKKQSMVNDLFEDMASKMEERLNGWQEEVSREEADEEYYEPKQETKIEKEGRESMKDIYRKLAVMLHPDRETDEEEKKRKTEVMKKITAAYRDKNLTELLKIELEETKSIMNKDKLSKESVRVRGMNHMLKHELEELRDKVYLSKRFFQILFNGLRLGNLSKKKIDNLFDEKVQHVEKILKTAKTDLENFTKNVKHLKKFARSLEFRYV